MLMNQCLRLHRGSYALAEAFLTYVAMSGMRIDLQRRCASDLGFTTQYETINKRRVRYLGAAGDDRGTAGVASRGVDA